MVTKAAICLIWRRPVYTSQVPVNILFLVYSVYSLRVNIPLLVSFSDHFLVLIKSACVSCFVSFSWLSFARVSLAVISSARHWKVSLTLREWDIGYHRKCWSRLIQKQKFKLQMKFEIKVALRSRLPTWTDSFQMRLSRAPVTVLMQLSVLC